MWLLLYGAGWIVTAAALAWSNRDAAPTAPDPVGVGVTLGVVWPLIWAAWVLAFVVTALSVLIARITDRKEARRG